MTTLDLLDQGFVQQALIAGAVLALLAGLLGPLVVGRGMAFAVHGTAELSFAGGAGALLLFGASAVGWGALVGAVLVALVFGALGLAAHERDSVIGVLLSFGLGLGVLFQSLYTGRSANKFGLLVGQIVGVDTGDLISLAVTGVVVIGVLGVAYRPLLFASLDPTMAAARGVPVRALAIAFAVLLGATTALGVQIVGALLVLSLLITPAAAAARLTASPLRATVLAVVFAEVAVLGGIVLSLAPGLPISPFVAGIAFVTYLICRLIGSLRTRRRTNRTLVPAAPDSTSTSSQSALASQSPRPRP
ncbi:metal ABC transporter permease [Actinomycetospora atypica]|uniref:Metal ABC transporter permease n=1 Tax=Actinomycetospora atypica TaxID=1290095 RepID=A0ABV9YT03_9PSEU